MKLKTFEIKSYRSLTDTKIEFGENLTSLIGINGAGKSNILNALLLLRKTFQRNRFHYLSDRENSNNKCRIKVQVEHNKKIISFRGYLYIETDERNSDEVILSKLKWDFSQLLDIEKWVDIPLDLMDILGHSWSNPQPLFPLGFEDKAVRNKRLKDINPYYKVMKKLFNGINYYSASQFTDPLKCPNFIELDEDANLRRFSAKLGHEKFIYDLYKSSRIKEGKFDLFLNTVSGTGIGLIDHLDFEPVPIPSTQVKVFSGGDKKKIDKNRILVIPTFNVGGNKLSPNQLSEGTFRALALIYYILNDDSEILLLEEPEVGIHQGLLSSIIALIVAQSKYKQIIISTHSDFILDQLRPENIILVKRESQKGTVAKSLTKTLKKNDFEALRAYLQDSGNLGDYFRDGGINVEKNFE